MTDAEVKDAVLAAAKAMATTGLAAGTSGNVSGRMDGGRMCITPSSVDYDAMQLDDLVVLDFDGAVVEGTRSPSSEKDMHLACYRSYEEVGGVIHSHPAYASMFAVARKPIPAAIEEFVVYIGGDVPVCEYTLTGTAELGEEAARNLKDRSAALLASHGMITIGATPAKALHAASVVERSAQIIIGARMMGGEVPLPEKTNQDFSGVYTFMRENRM